MIRTLSIFLLLAMTIPSLRTFVLFADYQINRAEMTAAFCENVGVDDSCQATCHMVKEIKKENPPQEDLPFVPNKVDKIELFYFENLAPDLSLENAENMLCATYTMGVSKEHLSGIFHPPKV